MTQATLKFTGVTKNPVKRKASPAQLVARQKFANMVRARAAAAKGKKMPRKNPMESALIHLSGRKYGQVKQEGHIYTAYVLQKVNTGIGEEMDLLDSKSFKTKSGAANWIAKNYGRQTNPREKTVSQKISQLEHEGYPHKQSIAIALSEQRKGKVKRNPSGEIGAYEITRNFKVLGIFKTKADAIKAAQGISDATGKTIAVKPVQVLAGHFDR
jgi:hypothetical protein